MSAPNLVNGFISTSRDDDSLFLEHLCFLKKIFKQFELMQNILILKYT